jgi:uncharacterized protein YfdQ (DUF2303 family)
MELQSTAAGSDIEAAIRAGQLIGKPFKVSGVDAVVVPEGHQVQTFENLVPVEPAVPQLLKQKVTLEDADSFIAYYNRFCDDASTIFAQTETGTFNAIFDYHQDAAAPRHSFHQANYTCPKTPEWSAWFQFSGQKMSQEEFGLFLEANIEEIVNPTGAQMLEIALTLKSKTNISFDRAVRLDNGQTQFNYVEEMNVNAGLKGQLEIPEEIELGLQPFIGSDHYSTRAKFRYRIREGKLVMWYDLVRPHKIVERAFTDVRTKIKAAMSAGMIINGKA